MKIHFVLILLFSVLVSGHASAQIKEADFFIVSADYNTNQKMPGAYIKIYKNKRKITELITDSVGKANFKLKLGSKYKIVVGALGKVDRFFYVDLKNVKKLTVQLSGRCEIRLFNEITDADYSYVLENAITRFYYEAPKNQLQYEMQSAMKMAMEIDRIQKEQE